MTPFPGFPAVARRTYVLPDELLHEGLPLIDDFAELQVVLVALCALQERGAARRFLQHADLLGHPALMAALAHAAQGCSVAEALTAGLERACAHGVLLRVVPHDARLPGGRETFYVVNSEAGRAAASLLRQGAWTLDEQRQVILNQERPNIYRLYEMHIGPLTPMIADRLKDAVREYSAAWTEEAVLLAVAANVRNWRYVLAVLDRWKREGKPYEVAQDSDERDGRRFTSGPYAEFVER